MTENNHSVDKSFRREYRLNNAKTAYSGFIQVEHREVEYQNFGGGWTKPHTREIVLRRPAVGVILVDLNREEIVLIEQFRAPAIGVKSSPWCIEIVAGMVEEDEAPDEVARRETQEEAGLDIQKLIPVAEYMPSAGASSEKMTLFCGIVDASLAKGVHGLDSEHEDILVHVVPKAVFERNILDSAYDNAALIVSGQWLLLNWQKLKDGHYQ